jgi:hypothetical protein
MMGQAGGRPQEAVAPVASRCRGYRRLRFDRLVRETAAPSNPLLHLSRLRLAGEHLFVSQAEWRSGSRRSPTAGPREVDGGWRGREVLQLDLRTLPGPADTWCPPPKNGTLVVEDPPASPEVYTSMRAMRPELRIVAITLLIASCDGKQDAAPASAKAPPTAVPTPVPADAGSATPAKPAVAVPPPSPINTTAVGRG